MNQQANLRDDKKTVKKAKLKSEISKRMKKVLKLEGFLKPSILKIKAIYSKKISFVN